MTTTIEETPIPAPDALPAEGPPPQQEQAQPDEIGDSPIAPDPAPAPEQQPETDASEAKQRKAPRKLSVEEKLAALRDEKQKLLDKLIARENTAVAELSKLTEARQRATDELARIQAACSPQKEDASTPVPQQQEAAQ